MFLRPVIRLSSLFLFLAAGLPSPAMVACRMEWLADPQERPETRPEHPQKTQEKREARPEHREAKQEQREEHRETKDHQNVPPGYARPKPMPPPQAMPHPQPMPRPHPYGQPGGTTETRPVPHSVRRNDPRGTELSHGRPYSTSTRSRAQAQAWEHSHGWRAEGAWGAHSTWREHRARAWESEHRSWAHRGGYGGYIIPYSHYLLTFGPEHWFRIRTRPAIHLGYPRFHYGNYWFLIVDPWPEFWSENWYATDDVYIDYDDGYYLRNRNHPGVSIAVSVSF